MSQRSNILDERSHDEILQRVEQALCEDSLQAHLRFVLLRSTAREWTLGFCRIDLCRPTEVADVPQYEYKSARTVVASLSGKEFLDWFRDLLTSNSPFECSGVPIAPITTGRWNTKRYYSHNQYSEWPCIHAELELNNRAFDSAQGPLVTAKDAPYFDNVLDLVREVSRFKTFHYDRDSRRQNLHLFIWDHRGRISAAVPEENELSISVDGLMTGLYLRGRISGDEQEKQVRVDAQSRIVEQLSAPLRKVELALITDDDEIVDLHERNFDIEFAEDGHGGSALDDEVEECLRAGESSRVEYKPFVRLERDNGRGDEKKEEIIKTALAMANARGGRILLGVSDQGVPNYTVEDWSILKGRQRKELQSEGQPPPQEAGGELEKTVTEYGRKLRDLIQKYASTSPTITLHTVFMNTLPVLLLRVDQSEEGPCLDTRDNSVWFRANATNRRPNAAELDGMVAKAKRALSE